MISRGGRARGEERERERREGQVSSSRGARGAFYKMPPLSLVPFFPPSPPPRSQHPPSPVSLTISFLPFCWISLRLPRPRRARESVFALDEGLRRAAERSNDEQHRTDDGSGGVVSRREGAWESVSERKEDRGRLRGSGRVRERVRDNRRSEKEGATPKRARRRGGGEGSAFASF